jgi:MoxR-like ATPase
VATVATRRSCRAAAQCREVYVDPSLMQYAVKLVSATRGPSAYGLPELQKYLTYGASPRATIGLIEGAKALALLRGRPTRCPRTWSTWCPTCCATAWCCPTRRWPRA